MPRAELHFHLLPGVDDGPATMDQTVDLARAAVAEGTSVVVATPHVSTAFPTIVSELPDRVREVQERLDRDGVALEVRCGAEIGHDIVSQLRQDELETVASGPPGSRWVLLESPFEGFGTEFEAAADELRDRGFGIVLAHPERSPGALDDGAATLRRERSRGTLLQVNAWSLLGGHGEGSRDSAERMVGGGWASVLASDAHGGWRLPALDQGIGALVALGHDPRAARRLTDSRPAQLLERGLDPVEAALAA